MKKTGLFKIIMFILLGITVATWIFSSSIFNGGTMGEFGMNNIGFFQYFYILANSFISEYFVYTFLLIITVGALYSVLLKTGKYRTLVEKISKKFKGKELIFLIVSSFVIAILSSVFDYGFNLFIFIPFIISIILAMGYDKITACVATFGSLLIGTIGNTIGANTSGVANELLSANLNNGIIFKIVLFVLAFAVLILFLSRAKIDKRAKNEEEDVFLEEETKSNGSVLPIIIIFGLLFVFLVLGCTNWESFNVNIFTNLNDKVINYSPNLPYINVTTTGIEHGAKETAIFATLFGNFSAFGTWKCFEMSITCFIFTLILGLCYKIKFKDVFEAMQKGVAKVLKPALMVLLAYAVLYFSANTLFFPTIAYYILGITEKFNLFFSSITLILASVFHVDFLYVASYFIPQIFAMGVDADVLGILTQGLYGVTMFVAPTSALLVLGLSYLGISYKDWLKRTWKLIIALLTVVILITVLAILI